MVATSDLFQKVVGRRAKTKLTMWHALSLGLLTWLMTLARLHGDSRSGVVPTL